MAYRTRTYIAADWDHDKDAVDQLRKWNDSKYWSLHFIDAHDLHSARDTSLNCSIKKSLKERMDVSKLFVLIVGSKTDSVTAGSCQYCNDYDCGRCSRGYSVDTDSYIKFECKKAIEANINIIVLYNNTKVIKSNCPEIVRNKGLHVPMKLCKDGRIFWNYNAVKKAFDLANK